MTDFKSKTVNSIKWSAIERIATQSIQLVIMLVLARMLGPKAFGLVGMLAIFIALAQTFVDSGFSNALIRKLDRSEVDFSTTFYFNVFVAIFCYLLLYLSAPFIANFYEQAELVSIARIIGFVIIVNSLSVIQRTRLTINLDFKTQAKASLLSVIISSGIAILFAYYNFGVWALVFQSLLFAILNALFLNIMQPWFPKAGFSFSAFRNLFSFGSKLLLSGLLETLYKNIYQIIIGKMFNSTQVGYFSQANQLSSVPATTLTSIIQRVTYPILSKLQNDDSQLESAYLLTFKLAAFVTFPLMVGLAVIAKPLLSIILGDTWLPATNLVSYLSIGFMLYPIHAINLNLLQVKGRSDLFLKLEIIKKIMITIVLLITIPFGIEAICVGAAFQSYLALIINTYYTGKLTKLTLYIQLKALLPIWSISLLCNIGALFFASSMTQDYAYQTIIIIFFASISYIFFSRILMKDLFFHITSSLFSIRKV